MRVHLIANSEVINTIAIESIELAQQLFPDHVCVEANEGGPGWKYENGQLTPPPVPPPEVPTAISPRQIRQALSAAGLRQQVEDAVNAGSLDLQDWWHYATEFERQHPMVLAMAQQLGVSAAQLDALWVAGAGL